MSHIHFIDGTAYDATAFGEYDANGVWKIKTDPSVTYGTNGFFILKDGNSVTDQSGNGNNFTVAGGTLTNTEDNPSNVFATLNPLRFILLVTFSKGN
jgi:Neuraminidase (sialidase)